ncbi:MAG: hypothetical protein ACYDA1_10395 [Vulcanimicrobiaceae bacterium]
MPSNFAEIGKQLQTAMPVPEIPTASIHNRLRTANARHRSHMFIACAIAAIAILGSGTVLAAVLFGGLRIWLLGDKAAVAIHSFTFISNPNAEDLRRVTADATFPVVLPVGIPKGMYLKHLYYSPADHPNFIGALYGSTKTRGITQFLLVDSSTVNHGEAPTLPDGQKLQIRQVTHWTVGKETVVTVTPQAAVKAAMAGVTPAASLAQTLPLLERIMILGGDQKLVNEADRIAPSTGHSTLIDRGHLSEVAGLVLSHKPMIVLRTNTVDDLPTVGGKPDFAHMKAHHTTETAVSTNGVRAIATLLATHVCGSSGKMGSGFTCEILINERSGHAYGIWVLPFNATTPPTKYNVDPTTFHITRG